MKLFSVIKWTLFLLLLLVIAGGAGAVWLWQRSDQLIEQQLLRRFESAAPDLELHIGRTRLLSPSILQLTTVQVRDRVSGSPLLHAAQVTVSIDEAELFDRQRLLVSNIEASGLDLILTRRNDGCWNWQDYQFRSVSDGRVVLPSVVLRDMRALVTLEHGGGIPSARLFVASQQFQAIPASQNSYEFQGDVQLPEAGSLALSGDWDLSQQSWQLGGQLRGVHAGQKLMDLARSANPGIETQLQQFEAAFNRVLPEASSDHTPDSTAILFGTSRLAPRFLGIVDMDFRVSGSPGNVIPDFLLKVDIRDGQLWSSAIPDKFTEVAATIFRDNSNLILRLSHARDGDAKLSGEFRMTTGTTPVPAEAKLQIERFAVDRRLQPFLPPKSRRFFDDFKPAGLVSGDVTLRQSHDGRWVPVRLDATIEDGSSEFHKFRYPVRQITGTIRQRPFGDVQPVGDNVWLDIDLAGLADDQPVAAVGFVRNPGPEAEMRFDLAVKNLAIDHRFRDALDEQGRKVISALDLTGHGTAQAQCYREPGPDRRMEMLLSASVSDASLRFQGFPYQINQLSGVVKHSTRDKQWIFSDLKGRHGEGELTARGEFRGKPSPGVLDLTVHVRNGAIDSDLYNALGSSQRELWTMLQPTGRVHLTTNIHWTALPGQKAMVGLPQVEIFDAEIFPRPFPYRMQIESAKISFDPNDPRFAGVQHCAIHTLQARHRGAPISASGWAELNVDNYWQLHLNDLTASNLVPDDDLRAALPESWRETLGRLSHRGRVSVESSQLDFRGRTTGDAPATAAWDMNLRLQQCGVMAGLNLDEVSGIVTARGSWNGSRLQNSGDIRLDTVEVLGMPLTRIVGPYSIDDTELLLGSRSVFDAPDPIRVPSEEQIRAEAYGGSLLLDGLVDLRLRRGYRLFGTINNARLEDYAQRHIPDQPNLKGIVNSWIYLKGEDESSRGIQGSGQLQISPAALYELPLMVKLLSALGQFNPSIQNRTAFDYALLTFDVREQAFRFNPIDLVGDSLALRGQGTIGFGGDVVLDFYSRPAKPRSPSIPLVNALLFTGATQWVGVQVRGTINRPQTEVRTAIQFDESLRQFLSAFQPNPNGPIPSLNIPSIFALPSAPQAMRPQ